MGVRRLPPDVGRMCRTADEAYGMGSGLICTGEGARGWPEEARPGRQREGEMARGGVLHSVLHGLLHDLAEMAHLGFVAERR